MRDARPAWSSRLAFGLVLAGALALRLLCFGGLRGWDDVDYILAARALRAHDYAVISSFSLRYPVIVPLAVVQAVIGEREWMQMLVPLGYSVAHLAVACGLGRLAGGPATGLLAMALLAIVPLDVMAATDLHADLAASVFMAAAMYAFARAEADGARRRAWLLSAGLALGLGFVTKESSLALVVVLAIRAWRRRETLPPTSHGWLGAGALAILALDALWLASVTGDPLYRLGGAGAGHVAIIMHDPPTYRWMLGYPAMLLAPLDRSFGYLAGVFYLVAAATAWGIARSRQAVVDALLWWLPLLAVFNFAPLDPTFTRPLFYHFARTIHPLLAPFVLAVAVWLRHGLAERRALRAAVVAGFAALATVGTWAGTADARGYARVARQVVPIVMRYPRDTPILTDDTSIQLLRFFLPERRDHIVRYPVTLSAAGGALLLYDPVFAAVEARAGFPAPRELAAPPASWREVATLDRPGRPSVRAALRRFLAGETGALTVPPASRRAVLWWIPAEAPAVPADSDRR